MDEGIECKVVQNSNIINIRDIFGKIVGTYKHVTVIHKCSILIMKNPWIVQPIYGEIISVDGGKVIILDILTKHEEVAEALRHPDYDKILWEWSVETQGEYMYNSTVYKNNVLVDPGTHHICFNVAAHKNGAKDLKNFKPKIMV